jgi:cytochrome bd-type quinol oxidase subunit 2
MEAEHSTGPAGAQQDRTVAEAILSGPGAAAVLAAGIGSLALGVFALAGDASPAIGSAFNIWNPSGPLSGVTTATVVVWLVSWYLLARRWSTRDVDLRSVATAALAMLAGGLLLTFPPFMDLLQGR